MTTLAPSASGVSSAKIVTANGRMCCRSFLPTAGFQPQAKALSRCSFNKAVGWQARLIRDLVNPTNRATSASGSSPSAILHPGRHNTHSISSCSLDDVLFIFHGLDFQQSQTLNPPEKAHSSRHHEITRSVESTSGEDFGARSSTPPSGWV
ncbi:uncharacterized protein BJX67DRAFT_87339 [Aspergillus lucknowensis]|uniref:Uncharacterized protein n=1 Tax=Aspergillus lucknowensis TaxID=176173 RepID=A0ABR4M5B5_9EURO